MKQQVDKLIANSLLIEGEVYLPEVGTLILCRQTAKLLSPKQLQVPHRELRLTKEQRCASITAHIMHVANVSEVRANDIYAEWLAQSLRDGVLTISMVCTIANGKITIDDVFENTVNPEGNSIIKLKPRKNGFARAMVAALICIALGAGGYYLYISGVADPILTKLKQTTTAKAEVEHITTPEATDATPIITEADSTLVAVIPADSTATITSEAQVDSTLVATAEPTTSEVIAEQAPTAEQTPSTEQTEVAETTETEILPLRKRYSYAVWGVYRELKNAEENLAWLNEKFPTVKAHIYKYDEKYLIALCEMQSRNACGRQVSRWKAQWKSFRSVWVYTR